MTTSQLEALVVSMEQTVKLQRQVQAAMEGELEKCVMLAHEGDIQKQYLKCGDAVVAVRDLRIRTDELRKENEVIKVENNSLKYELDEVEATLKSVKRKNYTEKPTPKPK